MSQPPDWLLPGLTCLLTFGSAQRYFKDALMSMIQRGKCRDSMKMSSVELDRNVLCKKEGRSRPIGCYERTFDDESEGTGIPEGAGSG